MTTENGHRSPSDPVPPRDLTMFEQRVLYQHVRAALEEARGAVEQRRSHEALSTEDLPAIVTTALEPLARTLDLLERDRIPLGCWVAVRSLLFITLEADLRGAASSAPPAPDPERS